MTTMLAQEQAKAGSSTPWQVPFYYNDPNGGGVVHTVDPFGGDYVRSVLGGWPPELLRHVEFYAMDSMAFYKEQERKGINPGIVFVDGLQVPGETPLQVTLDQEDYHQIAVEKSGYEPAKRAIKPEDTADSITLTLDPEREPRYPQEQTEIMAGRRPVSAQDAEVPRSLREVIVGPATAREIKWTRN